MASSDAKVWVRMPKDIHMVLAAQAEKERRSLNAQILVLLERVLLQDKGALPSTNSVAQGHH